MLDNLIYGFVIGAALVFLLYVVLQEIGQRRFERSYAARQAQRRENRRRFFEQLERDGDR